MKTNLQIKVTQKLHVRGQEDGNARSINLEKDNNGRDCAVQLKGPKWHRMTKAILNK